AGRLRGGVVRERQLRRDRRPAHDRHRRRLVRPRTGRRVHLLLPPHPGGDRPRLDPQGCVPGRLSDPFASRLGALPVPVAAVFLTPFPFPERTDPCPTPAASRPSSSSSRWPPPPAPRGATCASSSAPPAWRRPRVSSRPSSWARPRS